MARGLSMRSLEARDTRSVMRRGADSSSVFGSTIRSCWICPPRLLRVRSCPSSGVMGLERAAERGKMRCGRECPLRCADCQDRTVRSRPLQLRTECSVQPRPAQNWKFPSPPISAGKRSAVPVARSEHPKEVLPPKPDGLEAPAGGGAVSRPGNSAVSGSGWGASASATPSPRSDGCARASR